MDAKNKHCIWTRFVDFVFPVGNRHASCENGASKQNDLSTRKRIWRGKIEYKEYIGHKRKANNTTIKEKIFFQFLFYLLFQVSIQYIYLGP